MTEANDLQLHSERINVHKKMDMCKKDDKQKSRFFIASKGIDLSSDIWPSRSLKGSLQGIKLMLLDLLCHKRNSLITTVVYSSIFKNIFKATLERKMSEDIAFTRVLQWWNYNYH